MEIITSFIFVSGAKSQTRKESAALPSPAGTNLPLRSAVARIQLMQNTEEETKCSERQVLGQGGSNL